MVWVCSRSQPGTGTEPSRPRVEDAPGFRTRRDTRPLARSLRAFRGIAVGSTTRRCHPEYRSRLDVERSSVVSRQRVVRGMKAQVKFLLRLSVDHVATGVPHTVQRDRKQIPGLKCRTAFTRVNRNRARCDPLGQRRPRVDAPRDGDEQDTWRLAWNESRARVSWSSVTKRRAADIVFLEQLAQGAPFLAG
jgi:hypothetical protein